jgi:hypothetical protein
MKLTTHLQLMQRSRKRGSIHQLPIRLHDVVLNSLSTGNILPSNSDGVSICIYYQMVGWTGKKKGELSLCLTNYALCHEDVWGSRYINSRFLDLGTSLRWVVSFTPQTLQPLRKIPMYPLDRRLGDPLYRSGWCGEEKILDRTRFPFLIPLSPN